MNYHDLTAVVSYGNPSTDSTSSPQARLRVIYLFLSAGLPARLCHSGGRSRFFETDNKNASDIVTEAIR